MEKNGLFYRHEDMKKKFLRQRINQKSNRNTFTGKRKAN